MLKLTKYKRRIGIVALADSGKTVFLTSLINHLIAHDPEMFQVGDSRRNTIRKFKTLSVNGEEFKYHKFRDYLANGRWPEKTKDRYQFRCEFERTDWAFSTADLHFYDFPGERLADVLMSSPKYEDWCDTLLEHFDNDSDYRAITEPYVKVIRDRASDETKILLAYRKALAKLTLNFKPLISPSTFLLDTQGKYPSLEGVVGNDPEILSDFIAERRASGLTFDEQFSPLDRKARQQFPDVARKFAKRYTEYRRMLVDPLFQDLASCHQLIILVDIARILSSGVGAYDDCQQILRQLMGFLNPGLSIFQRFYRALSIPLNWRPGGVSRICFVASKADLTHPNDTDKLLSLLSSMVRRVEADLDGVETLQVACSAVKSTECPDLSQHELCGRAVHDETGAFRDHDDEKMIYRVDPLPERWPMAWAPNEFIFPSVYPLFPNRKDSPPEQYGLDTVFNFLMKERFWD